MGLTGLFFSAKCYGEMCHAHTKHSDSFVGFGQRPIECMSKGIFVVIRISVRCDKSVQTYRNNVPNSGKCHWYILNLCIACIFRNNSIQIRRNRFYLRCERTLLNARLSGSLFLSLSRSCWFELLKIDESSITSI